MTFLRTASSTLALTIGLTTTASADVSVSAVLDTYATIAAAKYADSLTTAQALNAAVDALITAPSDDTLQAARTAWLASRAPYQQTEVYRFGNPIVDDWEGQVNAWPLGVSAAVCPAAVVLVAVELIFAVPNASLLAKLPLVKLTAPVLGLASP